MIQQQTMKAKAEEELIDAEVALAKAKKSGDAQMLHLMTLRFEQAQQLHAGLSGDIGKMFDKMNMLKEMGL